MPLARPSSPVAACGFAPPFEAPHLVGIGGSGMKSLAELLRDLGCRVTGSDRRFSGGHCESNVPADCDALIFSPAIPADNPERTAAAALGISQLSLVDVLALLMQTRVGICIAGTHGKSTTTALTAWILRHAGREPSAFIGAATRTLPASGSLQHGGWAGGGELFVVESCEYRRHFLQLAPQHAVILNIEPDHFDTFPDEAALLDGFRRFAERVPPTGTLLVSGDCERCRRLASEGFRESLESFGAAVDCDWRFTDIRQTETGTWFRVIHRKRVMMDIESPLFGTHNLHNVLAAVAMASRLRVSPAEIGAAVRGFPGITRRFAPLGERRGISFFDDYAHHPTAVRVTLETARQRFGRRRLWCVFQPHQLLRTERLLDDFAAALAVADCALVTPVFAARETVGAGFRAGPRGDAAVEPIGAQCVRVARVLVERTSPRIAGSCRFCPSLDRVLPTLDDEARPGDVVILMGAGDIERIGHELAGRIPPDHAGQ